MSEMVERVVGEVRGKLNSLPFAERTLEKTVSLVIEAMREPTEAMLAAAYDEVTDIEIWHAMIDEALK